jgi:hypothetical protein
VEKSGDCASCDVVFESESPSRFDYAVQRDNSAEVLSAGEEPSLSRAVEAVESALSDQDEEPNRAQDEDDSQCLASAS